MKKLLLIGTILLSSMMTWAQQDPLISNYKFNYFPANPAAAGSEGNWALKASMRDQWVRFPGAPITGHFTAHGLLGRVGLGIDLFSDVIGPWENYGVGLGYAYHIPMANENSGFSIGLGTRATRVTLNKSLVTTLDPDPNIINGDYDDEIAADMSLGVYYYSNNLYAGLSVPQLVQFTNKEAIELERHYYLMAGYKFPISSSFTLDPSVMLRYVGDSPFYYEINLQGWFINEQLMFGAGYRTDNFITFQAGFNVNDRYRFAYAYDWNTGDLQMYTKGSHEVMVGFNFPAKKAASAE